MAYIPPVRAGDLITEGLLNRIVDQIERFATIRSSSPYILIDDGPHGKLIELDLPVQTWALLSGASSPYSFTEVRDGPGGTWDAMPNGDSGTANVYEANGKAGLAGKVVPITWTAAGDWRFQWVGYSCVGDASHICICACGTPYPVAATIGDDEGTHAMTGNTITKVWTSGTLTIAVPTWANPLGTCVSSSSGWDYVYTLTPNCTTGKWRLRLAYGAAVCEESPGVFVDRPGESGLTGVVSRAVTADIDIDCSNTSMLTFTLPTTLNGLTVPGGGGTLSVAF